MNAAMLFLLTFKLTCGSGRVIDYRLSWTDQAQFEREFDAIQAQQCVVLKDHNDMCCRIHGWTVEVGYRPKRGGTKGRPVFGVQGE